MGEDPQTVRLMRNKYTGEPAGYCFVNFHSDEQAIDAMHKLNGKPIPGTNPIVRFRLNSASNSNKLPGNEREFSVWVGDLSSEVDDYSLYRAFSNKYSSIKTAKVILDSSGFSKGYGFVRFGVEEEQKSALFLMNGFVGLGSKPLKICNAVPKPKDASKWHSTKMNILFYNVACCVHVNESNTYSLNIFISRLNATASNEWVWYCQREHSINHDRL